MRWENCQHDTWRVWSGHLGITEQLGGHFWQLLSPEQRANLDTIKRVMIQPSPAFTTEAPPPVPEVLEEEDA